MNTWYRSIPLVFAFVALIGLTACDQSSQNVSWETAEDLTITGPAAVKMNLPPNQETVREYYVHPNNQEHTYSWSIEGPSATLTERRNATFADMTSSTPGTYELTMNNETEGWTGSLKVDWQGSTFQELGMVDGFSSLQGAIGAVTPVRDLLNENEGPFTLLGPNNDALSGVSSVSAEVLSYHAIEGEIPSGDIGDGATVRTLLGPRLTFSVDADGNISVGGAADASPIAIDTTDVPAANGVIHGLEGVLTPPPASATFEDQTARAGSSGDTVTVAGAYLSDGGFVVIHEQNSDGSAGPVVGNSDYLESGFHTSIDIIVDEVTGETTLGAMPHRDDGDETYEFPVLGQDGPYTLNGEAIIDFGAVSPPQ